MDIQIGVQMNNIQRRRLTTTGKPILELIFHLISVFSQCENTLIKWK